MRVRLFDATRILGLLALVGLATLGIVWAIDRSRRWETPSLDPSRFVWLREGGSRVGRETWLVPINLRCPSCMARAHELAAGRGGDGRRCVWLVVDQRRRPTPVSWSELGDGSVWWDREDLWRRRWGHRLYAEVLRFDSEGRYLGTTPP